MPSTAPMHPWEWPCAPWSRIHIDYLGPFLGKMFLLIVDSHSKWVEVHVTTDATTATAIDKLQTTFAALGLPEVIVSDNGPAFCSDEFRSFMKQNGIQHVTTPTSCFEWPSRMLCTIIQGWYEEINRWVNQVQSSKISLPLSYYATVHHWHYPIRANVWKEAPDQVRFVETRFRSCCAPEANKAESSS